MRSYLYGADLAWWLLHLLRAAPAGQAVNVGSDAGLSVAALATLVRDELRPGVDVRLGTSRPGEPRRHYLPAIGRARALGLEAWTLLPLALQRTARWHQQGI